MELVYKVFDHIASGGFLMTFIVLDSVVLWFFSFKKLFFVREKDISSKDVLFYLEKRDVPQEYRGVKAEFLRLFIEKAAEGGDVETLLSGIHRVLSRKLWEDMELIKTLAVVAPLLGLLGTVMGMVKVFNSIVVFGAGNVKAMASGISEALITTQGGLMVAIPGIYMANFLRKRIEEKEEEVRGVIIILRRHL